MSKEKESTDLIPNIISGAIFVWMAYSLFTCGSDTPTKQKSSYEKQPQLTLERELEKRTNSLKLWNNIICTSNVTSIKYCLNQINEHAKFLSQSAEKENVSETTKKELKEMATLLKNTQSKAFPKMRDALGPAIRKVFWEHDVDAKTIGNGYRVASMTSWRFASNGGIKDFQSSMRPLFYQLRFNQTRYRWQKLASEYTYFDLSTPKDTDIVTWIPNSVIYLPVTLS